MSTCYLCEASLDSAIVVNTVARYDEPQTSVACSNCGLVQVVPMPSADEVDAYYASGEYRRKFPWNPVQGEDGQAHEHGTPEWDRLMNQASSRYAEHIIESIGKTAHHVIEWGCGNGMLLEAFKLMGMGVAGIEPDTSLHETAMRRNIKLVTDASQGYVRPDLAIAVHVLEHWREPLKLLEQMRAALISGGCVWIEVPNLAKPYGGLRHFFQRPHLYNFTADTLACLLVRAGFDDIHVAESGNILLAHATHKPDRATCGYAEAIERMRITLPSGAEIAAMLAEYTRQRETSPGARIGEWLGRRGDADDWIRDEFELMSDALTVTLHSLGKMGEDLDIIITEDTWHPNEWVLAYRCGGKEMAQRAQVAVTHLANNLAARATR